MVCASDDSVTPLAPSFKSGQLTTETSRASDRVKHVTLRRAFVVPGSIVSEFDEVFEYAHRLVFPSIDKEPALNPVQIFLRHIPVHVKEHFNQRTFFPAARNENIEEIQKYELGTDKLFDLFMGQLQFFQLILHC